MSDLESLISSTCDEMVRLQDNVKALTAQRDDLLEAAVGALPHLHWANTHGNRCDEAIEAIEQAICKVSKAESFRGTA